MWFRMSAPADYSWIAVGTGSEMKNSKIMFMAYEGSKDNSMHMVLFVSFTLG